MLLKNQIQQPLLRNEIRSDMNTMEQARDTRHEIGKLTRRRTEKERKRNQDTGWGSPVFMYRCVAGKREGLALVGGEP